MTPYYVVIDSLYGNDKAFLRLTNALKHALEDDSVAMVTAGRVTVLVGASSWDTAERARAWRASCTE